MANAIRSDRVLDAALLVDQLVRALFLAIAHVFAIARIEVGAEQLLGDGDTLGFGDDGEGPV